MTLSPKSQLQIDAERARAIDELLAAEPMPVDDWPVMKKQMLEDRYASVMRILDTYD
jgi:hypothetical protein